MTPRSEPIRAAVQASFESWLAPLRERLQADGFGPEQAAQRADLTIADARRRARTGPRPAECRRAARGRAPAARTPATPGGLMQQLTMTADRQVEWWDVPAPALQGPGEALVRPLAVALCDLDQPILRGDAPIPGPIAIGHEFVAEVTEVGDDVRSVAPGDRVVVPFQISCGACVRCRAGQTGDCTSVPPRSMYGFGIFGGDWGGALVDLVRVPFADAMLVAAPAGIAPAVLASASDNIPDGWRTVAPHLAAAPGRRRADRRRRRAEHRPLRGRRRARPGRRPRRLRRRRSGPAGGRGRARRRDRGGAAGRALRRVPDHRRRQRRPRRPARGAALDRARRRVHEHRHLLRGADAGPAAGDVHDRRRR